MEKIDCWYDGCVFQEKYLEEELKFRLRMEKENDDSKIPLLQRSIRALSEPLDRLPERFFILKLDHCSIVGTKFVSDLVLKFGHPGLFCSKITQDMLLGVLESFHCSSEAAQVVFRPFFREEKDEMFQKIKTNQMVDIYFPFTHVSKIGERSTPKNGWFVTKERAVLLSLGEAHLREQSLNLLKKFNTNGKIIFDPACSTGEFLSFLKSNISGAKFLGQDLSSQMIEVAKEKLENVYVQDARNPIVLKNSVDFLFSRFLNSEVVTRKEAQEIFPILWETIKPGGFFIAFGHTPVLLNKFDFFQLGGRVLQCSSYCEKTHSVFQYFVVKKSEGKH